MSLACFPASLDQHADRAIAIIPQPDPPDARIEGPSQIRLPRWRERPTAFLHASYPLPAAVLHEFAQHGFEAIRVVAARRLAGTGP